MARKVFVSFNFKDSSLSYTLNNMTQSTGCHFVYANEHTHHIDQLIKDKMRGCCAALFVVGNDNHNSPWINREVELANSMGLTLYVTQLPNTNGGLPNELKDKPYQCVSWSESGISSIC